MNEAHDAGPDSDVTAEVRAHRVRTATEDIPWPRGQCGAQQRQPRIRRCHAQPEPEEVGPGEIKDSNHEGRTDQSETDMPKHAAPPVRSSSRARSAHGRTPHGLLGRQRPRNPPIHARSPLSRQQMSAGTTNSSATAFTNSAAELSLYRAHAMPAPSTVAATRLISPRRPRGGRNPCRLRSRHRASPNMSRLAAMAATATPEIP